MPVPRLVHWEVRADGDNANGGAFNATRSGAAKTWNDNYTCGPSYTVIQFTNLYSNGAALNTLRSDSYTFSSSDVGHVINLTGGTNIIPGRYEITSVSGGIATLDSNCWTAQNTQKDGAGRLGGAIAHPSLAVNPSIYGGTGDSAVFIWVRDGTYDWTAAQSRTGNYEVWRFHIEGYSQSRGDRAARPVWRAVENNVKFFTPSNATECASAFWNIEFDGNGYTGVEGIFAHHTTAANCIFRGMVYGVAGTFNRNPRAVRCHAIDCTTGFGERCDTVGCRATGCTTGFRGRGTHTGSIAVNCERGFYETATAIPLDCTNCAAIGCTNEGFYDQSGRTTNLVNCLSHGNGGDGFRVEQIYMASLVNCIATNNGGFGFRFQQFPGNASTVLHRLRGWGNTAGLHNIIESWASWINSVRHTCADDVASLTGLPFVDTTNGDFRLKARLSHADPCRAQLSDPPDIRADWEPRAFNVGLLRQFDEPEPAILLIGEM